MIEVTMIKHWKIATFTLLVPLLLAGCFTSVEQSDIRSIKTTFGIPDRAKTVLYRAKPQDIVRENLRIVTQFKLSDDDAQRLQAQVQNSADWKRFPISRNLLGRMRVDRVEEIFYGQFSPRGKHIWYSCRHSGNDILNTKTVITEDLGPKLRDYMFAVIDFKTNVVWVKVRTAY